MSDKEEPLTIKRKITKQCYFCGRSLGEVWRSFTDNRLEHEEETSEDTKFCSNCGKKIKKIAKYCEFCGSEV